MGFRERPVLPDAPDEPAPWIALDPAEIAVPPDHGWRATWLGHAGFLLQGCGLSLLVDPIFSSFCGPLRFLGLRRLLPPPCRLLDLPAIDAVLLTHGHYDHLDLPTLQALGPEVPLVTPIGYARWLRRRGFRSVTELAWWDSLALTPDVQVMATPAQHFSARSPWDRNRMHWGGWLVQSPTATLWHAGDSAWCPAFRELGDHHGPISFGMIPIGAYQPNELMRSMHMNPEEAVTVFLETRCQSAAPMHWGTFRLTDEPMAEPPLRLQIALANAEIPSNAFLAKPVGSTWLIPPNTPAT